VQCTVRPLLNYFDPLFFIITSITATTTISTGTVYLRSIWVKFVTARKDCVGSVTNKTNKYKTDKCNRRFCVM